MHKRVLITGKNGYIGKHIQEWLLNEGDMYDVIMLNVRTEEWKNENFKDIDVIVHAAGIVHQPHITDWDIYKKTNVDLTVELAQKAKCEGVKQFIFLSTMAVYGKAKRLNINVINEETEINPINLYGKSKYLAEQKLLELQSDEFRIVIVRPPNVYGRGCKGGYISGFRSAVSKLPAIPYAYSNVKQSLIFIDNLCEFIQLVIRSEETGIFMPQDKIAVSAVDLMSSIAGCIGKKKIKSRFLGVGIYILSFLPVIKKAYGGVAYSELMSAYYENKYVVVPFEEGIRRTIS